MVNIPVTNAYAKRQVHQIHRSPSLANLTGMTQPLPHVALTSCDDHRIRVGVAESDSPHKECWLPIDINSTDAILRRVSTYLALGAVIRDRESEGSAVGD